MTETEEQDSTDSVCTPQEPVAVLLYNRTKLPDDVLLPVIQLAAELTGAQGPVVVKVRPVHGSYAQQADMVDEDFLLDRRRRRVAAEERSCVVAERGRAVRADARMIATTGGYAVIRAYGHYPQSRYAARSFLHIAIHEFAHICDFQRGTWSSPYAPGGTRKLPWWKRPDEIRAENTVVEAWLAIKRSRPLRRRVRLLLANLAQALAVAYPRRSEFEEAAELHRSSHYRNCKTRDCTCPYGRYLRERAAIAATGKHQDS
jgi:hypothetical protein